MTGLPPYVHVKTGRDRLRDAAHKAIRIEIREGRMLPPTSCECVDCGEPAYCYDHRDYTKPLSVQPVCRACNNRRGPGLPLPTATDNAQYKNGVDWKAGKCWDCAEAGEGYEPLIARLCVDLPFDIESEHNRAVTGWTMNISRPWAKGERWIYSWADRADYFKRRDPWYA